MITKKSLTLLMSRTRGEQIATRQVPFCSFDEKTLAVAQFDAHQSGRQDLRADGDSDVVLGAAVGQESMANLCLSREHLKREDLT